jgi:hypothetical protein
MIKYLLLLVLAGIPACSSLVIFDAVSSAVEHKCACEPGTHTKFFKECTDKGDGTGNLVEHSEGTHWCCSSCSKICMPKSW